MTQYQKASLTEEMVNSIKEQIKDLFFKKYNKEVVSYETISVSKIEKLEFDSGKLFIAKNTFLIFCNVFCRLEEESKTSYRIEVMNKDKIVLYFDSNKNIYKIMNPPKFEIKLLS